LLECGEPRLRDQLIVLRHIEACADGADHLVSTMIGRPPSFP
jgi:hypothetical protein